MSQSLTLVGKWHAGSRLDKVSPCLLDDHLAPKQTKLVSLPVQLRPITLDLADGPVKRKCEGAA